MYAEHHYQPVPDGGAARKPLIPQEGTVAELMEAICRQWNYRMVYRDGVCYLWPYNWAMARHCDIPEHELRNWRERSGKQGRFSVDDRAQMTREFTLRQLAYTMRVALPKAGRWERPQWNTLRLYAALTRKERETARGKGVPVEALQVGPRGLLLREWVGRERLQREDFTGSRLFIEEVESAPPPGQEKQSHLVLRQPNERPLGAGKLTLVYPAGPGVAAWLGHTGAQTAPDVD